MGATPGALEAGMRTPSRSTSFVAHSISERGASALPFIITLLLMLFFVWKWFEQTELKDSAAKELAEAQQELQNARNNATQIVDKLEELSQAVGFTTDSMPVKVAEGKQRNAIQVTDINTLRAHLSPDGMLAGAEGADGSAGTMNALSKAAVVTYTRKGRLHKEATGKEVEVKGSGLSAEFEAMVGKFLENFGEAPKKPAPPTDPDDTEAKSQYDDDIAAWRKWHEDREAGLADLAANPEYKEYTGVIRLPSEWGETEEPKVQVNYLNRPEGGANTVEAILQPLVPMVNVLKKEISAIQTAAAAQLAQVQAAAGANKTEADAANAELASVRDEMNSQIKQRDSELSEKTDSITRLQNEVAEFGNQLEQAKTQWQSEKGTLENERDSYREGLHAAKARRDHQIRRDDVKGTVLLTSQALRTGTIDRGSADRIYVGQKFVVSSKNRAGNRVDKGEIVVTKVMGRHASKFRIVGPQSQAITGGDSIHNPLYDPSATIHVVLAGKLDKWPRNLAVQRLKKLNVVVQDAPNGKTDYVVVPNSWSAPIDAGGDEEEEDDGAEAAVSPLEQVAKTARRFGAQVVTERIFDVFLDY